MKKRLVCLLQKQTQEFEENDLSKLIYIFLVKIRHHNYHSSIFKYGKLILIFFTVFFIIAIAYHYFNKDLREKKYHYSEATESIK